MTKPEFQKMLALLEGHWLRDTIPAEAEDLYWEELREFSAGHVATAIEAIARSGKERVPLPGQLRQRVIALMMDIPNWAQAIGQLRNARQVMDAYKEPEECPDDNSECDYGWITKLQTYDHEVRSRCKCARSKVSQDHKRALRLKGESEPCSIGVCDGTGIIIKTEPTEHMVSTHCSCWEKRRPDLPLHPIVHSFARLVTWPEVNRMFVGDSTLEAQMRNKYEAHVRDAIEGESLRGLPAHGLARLERVEQTPPALPPASGPELLGDSFRRALPAHDA